MGHFSNVWKLVLVRLWRMTGYLLWDWCIFTEILKWTCTKQWKCSYLPRHEGQIFDNFKIFCVVQSRAFERGVHPVASVRGPENQERARESLKCPMDLAIDVLFWFVHYLFGIFNSYFYDFSIEFLELFRQCDIFFPFYYRLWRKNYDDVPASGPPKEILQGGTILLWGLRTGWNFSMFNKTHNIVSIEG
jgi:hypothetical protein